MQVQDTSRGLLHREVEAQGIGDWHVRAVLHALVELGQITKLECQLPDCPMDSREFVPRTGGRGQNGGKGIVVDHINPRLQGGGDRPDNLQILHQACNSRRARGWTMTPEARAKLSAIAKARPAWRRPGGRGLALTREQVLEMRTEYADGSRVRDIAERYDVCYATAHAAVYGRKRYADIT